MNESVEANIRQCKVCKRLLSRVLDGKFNTKDKKWISFDEEGKPGLWNGNTCPSCNRERVKNHMKALRRPNVAEET